MARTRGARLAPALVALALLEGCGGSAPAADVPDPGSSVGLTGRVLQYRDDLARAVLQVELTADRPLDVESVVLDAPGFPAQPPTAVTAPLPPGGPVDLPVPYGEPRCTERPAPGSAVVVVRSAGTVHRVRVPLADSTDLLPRLHASGCAVQAVRAQAELSFSGPWTPGPRPRTLTAPLRVRRLGGTATVTVPELGDNTIFTLRTTPDGAALPPGVPVLSLPPGTAEATVPLSVEATRCDAHALAESKRTTAFRVFVSLDGGPPVLVVVSPDAAGVEALVQFATDSCAGRAA